MSHEHELENNMLRLIPNLLRVLAGGGDLVRLRDDLADVGRVITAIEVASNGTRGPSVDAIGAALNKLFEEDRQREMRDKTGRASAEHRVIQQALRFAAGNGNDRELWRAIASFNETVA